MFTFSSYKRGNVCLFSMLRSGCNLNNGTNLSEAGQCLTSIPKILKQGKNISAKLLWSQFYINHFPDHYFLVQRLFQIPLNAYATKIHTFPSWFNQVGMYSMYSVCTYFMNAKRNHSSLFLFGYFLPGYHICNIRKVFSNIT